ncbi:MAG: heme biosynthesis HemY N-terminal domain-containing protein [Alphaproteobacteria bacterium]|jgi:HemY protein|nr:heme biosynthesis HemY N-terminal domain-containing protein [Alphaproteobacteria bacterium]
MLRALVLFLALSAVAVAAVWLADHPGNLIFDWGDLRIETSALVAGGVLFLALVLVLALYRLWRRLAAGPVAWRRRREAGRQQRGYAALTQGLVAVAGGDAGEGQKLARRAEALLEEAPLTLLLQAQAAQLEGDEAAARRHFEALRALPETEFLGVRGLLVLAKRAGERGRARQLAEAAFRLRPDAVWAAEELYQAQASDGDWDAALATIEQAGKRRGLAGAAAQRRRALALYGQALAAEAEGAPRRALDKARKAQDRAPDFVPAAVLAIRLTAAAGDRRRARRLFEAAWRRRPHPALAQVSSELDIGADAEARLKALKTVAVPVADDLESRLLIAAHAIEAGDWDGARGQLDAALEAGDGPRVCRLYARLAERADGDPLAARRWLERAAAAPPDPAWLCRTCGWRGAEWTAFCPHCGDFDSADWTRPPGDAPVTALFAAEEESLAAEAIAPPAELLQMDQAAPAIAAEAGSAVSKD